MAPILRVLRVPHERKPMHHLQETTSETERQKERLPRQQMPKEIQSAAPANRLVRSREGLSLDRAPHIEPKETRKGLYFFTPHSKSYSKNLFGEYLGIKI